MLADGGATKDPIQHLLPQIQDREMLQLLNGRALPSTIVINGPSGVGKGTLIGQVRRLRLYINLLSLSFCVASPLSVRCHGRAIPFFALIVSSCLFGPSNLILFTVFVLRLQQ